MFNGLDKFLYYSKENSFKKSMFILFIIVMLFIICCVSESLDNKKFKNKTNAQINQIKN